MNVFYVEDNIEETPFFDKTKVKKLCNHEYQMKLNDYPDYNLQTYLEEIKWKQIKPTKKWEDKHPISNQKDRKIIDDIITLFKTHQTFDLTLSDNPQLIKMLAENIEMISKYSYQKYPQAVVAQYLFTLNSKLNIKNTVDLKQSVQRLNKIANQSLYPLSYVLLAFEKMKNGLTGKKVKELFTKAIDYGETYAFQHYGYLLFGQGQSYKAYEMYKNAEKNGYAPIIYYRLGQLFISQSRDNFPRSQITATRYFSLTQKCKAKPDKKLLQNLTIIYIKANYQQQKANKILSTLETQSKIVSNFIKTKYQQQKIIKSTLNDPLLYNFCSTNATKTGGQYTSFKPKAFYVVFSPMMMTPARGFLAQDQNGVIQSINIYNWQKIPPSKLQLLHKLGTVVILRQYTRKYGANDRLPIYRIQNPYAVEIYPGIQKVSISDKKYRQFAVCLFNTRLYDQCKTIYNHLIKKNASQLQGVYYNLGLISEKEQNIQQAQEYYIKSLMIRNHSKSAHRLAKIYLNFNKIQQAKQLVQRIREEIGKKEVLKLIEQKQKQKQQKYQQKQKQNYRPNFQIQKQFQNFSIKTLKFVKKNQNIPHYILQKLFFQNFSINKSQTDVIVGDEVRELVNKNLVFTNLLSLPEFDTFQQYIEQLQKIQNDAQLPLKQQNIPRLKKFFIFGYYFLKKCCPKIYDQAYGYQIHFFIENAGLPVYRDMGMQISLSKARKLCFLEKRIENQCIQLQRNKKYDKAAKLLDCANEYCIPFCLKISSLLFKQGKYQQNVTYCHKILNYLRKYPNQKILFRYFISIGIQLVRSLQMLKRHSQSLKQGLKLLKQINHYNPKYISLIQIEVTKEQVFKCQKQQNIRQTPISQINYDLKSMVLKLEKFAQKQQKLKVCILKKYIANAYNCLNNYNQALKYIDEDSLETFKKQDQQGYFQTLIMKVKILTNQNKQNKKLINNLLQESLQLAYKLNVDDLYKAAIIKQMLMISLKQRQINRIVDLVSKIIYLKSRYLGSVVQMLAFHVKDNANFMNNIINELYNKCAQVAEGLNQQLKLNSLHNKYKNSEGNIEINNAMSNSFQIELQEQFQNNFEGFSYLNYYQYDNKIFVVYFHNDIQFQKGQKQKFMHTTHGLSEYEKNKIALVNDGGIVELQITEFVKIAGKKILIDGKNYLLFVKKIMSKINEC